MTPNRRQFLGITSGIVWSSFLLDSPAWSDADAKKNVRLFDGKSLDGWKVIDSYDFKRHGPVEVRDGSIYLAPGDPSTGIRSTHERPSEEYVLTWKARRVAGGDFFCGLTFPILKQQCTLIVGGWGGGVVGLSNVNDANASENETSLWLDVTQNQWYAFRLTVQKPRILVEIDSKRVIDLETAEKRFSIWTEQEPVAPLGFSTWNTGAELRDIVLETL